MRYVRKYVKKAAKTAGRVVKKRYFKGKGYSKPRISNMVRDINTLKSMVNAEKKRVSQVSSSQQFIGQVNGNGSGHYLLDITPNPPQGTGYNQKTGNSIKWHASHFDFQFTGQVNMISGQRIKIQIIKIVGQPLASVPDLLGKFIVPTAFITGGTVYDINSDRDPDYYKNYRVLKTHYVYLKPDQITGEIVNKRVKFGIKLANHHVRNNDNDPTLSMGQVVMLMTADQGNLSLSTTSTLGFIPISGTSTGSTFVYEHTHYYYDN